MDFSKSIDGFAKVENSKILLRTKSDSMVTYNLDDFKTIYTQNEVGLTTYFISGILVTATILGYLLANMNLSGG